MPSERPVLEMLRIAAPVVATMTSYTAMTFTDKWLCSRLGADPIYVGAQGNGGLAAWVPISIAHGVLTVVNTYVAQHLGAGRPERAPAYAWNGIWLSVVFYLVLLLPYGFVVRHVFDLAGTDPAQAELATQYGRVLVFGSFLTLTSRAVGQFFYGLHRASVVMVAGVSANVLNLFLSAALAFGDSPPESLGLFGRVTGGIAGVLGTEPMGVAGSAWGTVIATLIELAIPMMVFLGPKLNATLRTRAAWRPSPGRMWELLRLGWPQGAMFGNEMVCWGFFMVHLVSHFGAEHATAGWIAHQYMSISFMPAVGLSVACTALVGKYQGMGRSDLAQHRAWLVIRTAIVWMGLCGVAFLAFREPLVRLFVREDTSPEAIERIVVLGSRFLVATAAFQLFDAVAMTVSGALRGAGDTFVPGLATVLSSWGIIVGGGLAITHLAPRLESLGAWIAAATYIFALCVFLLGRFLTGKWKAIRLVEGRSPEGGSAGATTDGIV